LLQHAGNAPEHQLQRRRFVVEPADVLNPRPVGGSDRVGEFGERGGDPQGRWCVESEFVVAASEVLHEGVSGDDHVCCLVGS
jgi:hypothetical protein